MSRLRLSNQGIKDYYEARYRGSYMEKHHETERTRVKDTLEHIPTDIHTVLDYGCGQGAWIDVLSILFPHARIAGIDISEGAIEKAKQRFPSHQFFLLDAEKAPFEDNSFDLVFSYHVLEHVYDLHKIVHDMARLVGNEGHLCVILPCGNEGSFEQKVINLIRDGKESSISGEMRFFCEDPGHIRRMKSEEIIDLFRINDATIFKEFYSGQRYGGFYQIDRKLVNKMFDSSRAVDNSAKVMLISLKLIFGSLSLPIKLASLNLCTRIANSNSLHKKLFFSSLIPLKMLSLPVAKIINALELFEWRRKKGLRNGSCQYLIFRKH